MLPVLDVDAADAAHEQLQLPLVEDLEEGQGDQLVEAGKELGGSTRCVNERERGRER